MKTIKSNPFLTALAALCFLTACTDLTIHDNAEGVTPEAGQAYTSLRAERVTGQSIAMTLTLGETADTEESALYLRSSQPFEKSGTAWLDFAGEDFVNEYSESKGIEYKLLPAAFYSMKGGNSIDISAGSMETGRNSLVITTKNLFGNVIAPGRYLLPVVCDGSSVCEVNETTILIDLTVREPYTDPDGYELYTEKDLVTILYLNTSMFDPRLANDMVIEKIYPGSFRRTRFGIGNIVNLRSASVGYDEISGKVTVQPSNDLRYVLEHYTERVLPVQESGRKVCVCIEGGGKGIGFCNITDEQIADFTVSVKRMVDTYGLDGINLWDRNTGYGKEDCPEMNTTSYPKLIRELRKALGQQKLLTVVDYREQTEYFDDVQKTGGIAVGEYIDYAWHGYNDANEFIQVVDPWAEDKLYHSQKYHGTRIAGLDHIRYGCLHWSPGMSWENMTTSAKQWCEENRQNLVFVFYDVESILQHGGKDGGSFTPGYLFNNAIDVYYQQNMDRIKNTNGTGTSMQYGKWLKDW